MVIQHCIEAMNANGQLKKTTNSLEKSTRKLSSGYKINIAADDAAGLSISEKMRRQIRGLTQASENAEDGVSLVQIADGAMAEIQDMLDRGVELSVKAANGTLSDSDRADIQKEITQIRDEIDAIKERTKFNEIYVLKGDTYYTQKEVPGTVVQEGGLPAWVTGGQAFTDGKLTETYTTTQTYTTSDTVNPTQKTTTINHAAASLDFSQFNSPQALQELIGQGFHTTCCTCSDYYSIQFTDDTKNESEVGLNQTTYIYKIGIGDIDMTQPAPQPAQELLKRIIDGTNNGYPDGHYTKLAVDGNVLWIYDGRSMDSESATKPQDWGSWVDWEPRHRYYNTVPRSNTGLVGEGYMKEYPGYENDQIHELGQNLALQVGADTGDFMFCKLPSISSESLGIDKLDVTRQPGGPEEAMTAFSDAKDNVSVDRSRLGAYQNRLEHTINNLDNIVENTTAAESQIRDTDMADEMVKYSNTSIIAQAGQSMLAQANQSHQGVITLIG